MFASPPRNYFPEAASAPVPPAGYAKPGTHAIYYAQGVLSDANAQALAKYDAISVTINGYGDATRCGAAMRAIRTYNPDVELYYYGLATDASSDENEYDYGGTYGKPYAELKANNWFRRKVSNARVREFTDNGTLYPLGGTNERGTWVSGASYTAYTDIVTHLGVEYRCTVSNSDVSFTPAKWSTFLGVLAINFLPDVLPNNAAGLNWMEWYARHAHYVATRDFNEWTGMFYDVMQYYTAGPYSANWLQDGVDRTPLTHTPLKRSIESAHALLVTELQSLHGSANFKILGNTPGRTVAGDEMTEFLVTQNMRDYVDGSLYEAAISRYYTFYALSVAGVSQSTDNSVMATWPTKASAVRNPSASVSAIGVRVPVATEYATVRLGTALALMQDSRVSVSTLLYTDATVKWYDEWDAELGAGIDPKLSTWNGGLSYNGSSMPSQLWLRRFQNGVVLLNESKATVSSTTAWATATSYVRGSHVSNAGSYYVCDVPHTSGTFATDRASGYWYQMPSATRPGFSPGAPITIDNNIIPSGVYKRIDGTQDAAWNDGSVVSGSFSLPGWDAIILLCVTPGVHA